MTRLPRAVSSRSARLTLSAHLALRTLLRRAARIATSTTLSRRPRKPALGNLSTRTLVIVVFLATIGLARGHQARAQGEGALVVAIVTMTDDQISMICTRNGEVDQACFKTYKKTQAFLGAFAGGIKGGQALPPRHFGRSRAEASDSSSTFAPTLESSVPTLPFLGNWLTALSWIPNATTAADVTAAYAVGLARRPDCSLDEVYVLPSAGLPDAEYLTSLTDAQDYFHQLAGLTTKPDVFANGCTPQVLGLSPTGIGLLLGSTSDGAAIGAQLTIYGLYVTVTDLTANTVKNTQLSNSQNAGYFSAASLRNNGIFDIVETSLTDPATQKLATAVFLGNGDGTFQPPVYYDVSDNGLGQFTIDDVNGDGIPDIVELTGTSITNPAARTFSGTVTTLIGKGDGTFTIGPASAATGFAEVPLLTGVFKTGDVKDLLIGGTVLFGAGNGSFTQGPTNTAIASMANYLFPSAVGSLRINGKLDVVVTQPGFVSIFYGNGDGTFTTGPIYAALPDYMQVTITDIDGDGNPDIVLGASSGGVYTEGGYDTPLPMFQILMGRGDGTFVDSLVYNQGTYGIPADANNSELEIASADFNGDSKLDVLAFSTDHDSGSASSLLMLPGDGKGNLGAASRKLRQHRTVLPRSSEDESRHDAGRVDCWRGFFGPAIVGAHQSGQWDIRRRTGLPFAQRSRQPGGGRLQWRWHPGCCGRCVWRRLRAARSGQRQARPTRPDRLLDESDGSGRGEPDH